MANCPDDAFSADFEATPYWWRAAPRIVNTELDLPNACDVAVVGSGFGGAVTALTLAQAGHSVVVFDEGALGAGACSRNMGGLVDRVEGAGRRGSGPLFGRPVEEFEAEGVEAGRLILRLASEHGIECNIRNDGGVRFASTAEALAAERSKLAERKAKKATIDDYILDRREISAVAGGTIAQRYFGALVSSHQRTLHPGKLINGLLGAAGRAGTLMRPNTRVLGVTRAVSGAFYVMTTRGVVLARQVVVTTAGYSDAAFPEMHKRVLPFGAHVIATARIGEELLREVSPERRMFSDTRQNWMLVAPAPDEPRLLFSGAYLQNPDVHKWAPKLRAQLTAFFPELACVPITNAWFGLMPINSQMLPQLGIINGVFYASDTSWAVSAYLGHKIALRILGQQGSESVFDHVPLTAFPSLMQPPLRLRLPARFGMAALDALRVAATR